MATQSTNIGAQSDNQPPCNVGFIGTGRAGSVLATALHHAGYRITALYNRSLQTAHQLAQQLGATVVSTPPEVAAQVDLVFITTVDSAIEPLCRQIADQYGWKQGQAVIHCSGALGRDILAGAAAQGAQTGGFHPLQTLPNIELGLANLPGSYFGIEAHEPLRSALHRLAYQLGGHPLDLEGRDRALYHAAAAIASNYTVTLFATAVQILSAAAIAPAIGKTALLPLLRGTVMSIEQEDTANALTGPIARGDAATAKRHLQALAAQAPDTLPLYRTMASATILLARARGLAPAQAELIEAILQETLSELVSGLSSTRNNSHGSSSTGSNCI